MARVTEGNEGQNLRTKYKFGEQVGGPIFGIEEDIRERVSQVELGIELGGEGRIVRLWVLGEEEKRK